MSVRTFSRAWAAVAVGAMAVLTASVASTAEAATTASTADSPRFETWTNGNFALGDAVQFAPSSSGQIRFVKAFEEGGQFSGATAGDPNTPRILQWDRVPSGEKGFIVLRNRATGQCVDIPRNKQNVRISDLPDKLIGVGLVSADCDASSSQKFKENTGTGNHFTFRNQLAGLFFAKTTSGGRTVATLQRPSRQTFADLDFFPTLVEISRTNR
ncbi:RICIN domain-containing protein [Kribbella sp. NPDC055071]